MPLTLNDHALGLDSPLSYHKDWGRGSYTDFPIHRDALNTSYEDFYLLMNTLAKRPCHFIDCGAGLGRSIFVANSYFPHITITGLEMVAERVDLCQKSLQAAGLDSSQMQQYDLMAAPLPLADVYFFYLPVGPLFYRLTHQLMEYAQNRAITIICVESHGDFYRHLDLCLPFLPRFEEVELQGKRHHQKARIYHIEPMIIPSLSIPSSFMTLKEDEIPQALWQFATNHSLAWVIEDQKGLWLADCSDPWLDDQDGIHFTVPARSVKRSHIRGLIPIPLKMMSTVKKRRAGELINGLAIRKIYWQPSLVEFSNGQIIPLSEIVENSID